MRKFLIFLFISLSTQMASGQIRPLFKKNHEVNKLLRKVVAAPDFKTAGFAFFAMDMESGETIAMVNPDMALRPASTLKLLTTATALELLGPAHHFQTTLELSKTGDLIIKGGGDPTLGSSYFPDSTGSDFLDEWVYSIKLTGADTLARVIADASYFSPDMVPPAWSWQNMGQYYGAGPCGLSIYDNTYTLFFDTPDQVGESAIFNRVEPFIPLEIENRVSADSISWDNSYIFGAPYSNERLIQGTLPLGQVDFDVRGSMPDPAWVAASQLDSALNASGIFTTGESTTRRLMAKKGEAIPNKGRVIHTTTSPGLAEIITETNTHSVNLFAEHFLLHAGIQLGSYPETVAAADSLTAFWNRKGMDTDGLSMHDGSGLSQYNAITPRQMVWLLNYMHSESEYAETFYNSMAIAGESGTLESLFKGSVAEGKLRAKSGTISKAKAYAGYVTSQSGRKIAFSMVANGFSGSSRQARAKLEQLMIALAEFDK